jgi:hypothetical protein
MGELDISTNVSDAYPVAMECSIAIDSCKAEIDDQFYLCIVSCGCTVV